MVWGVHEGGASPVCHPVDSYVSSLSPIGIGETGCPSQHWEAEKLVALSTMAELWAEAEATSEMACLYLE